ncbi:hypothetical protein [Sphingomonas sp. ID0503]|uniref:hypothetical protein n=1 Tax=Sphingomonas sp. ID0503 TaxID=3399691 RepID=UPI003AFADCB6
MRMIRPVEITPARLTSSNVVEGLWTAYSSGTTYALNARAAIVIGTAVTVYRSLQAGNTNHDPASSPTWWRAIGTTFTIWSAAATYAKGERVIDPSIHRVFQSLQAGNTGHALTDPAWWQDIGPTNRYAMFDKSVGTLTTVNEALTVQLSPGGVDALAVIDTTANTVTVTMVNGSETVYSATKTTAIGGAAISDWYAYFFEPVGKLSALSFYDLPIYPDAVITVTMVGDDPAGAVSAGTLIVGRTLDMGVTETGPGVGITDYSRKETDEFGVTSVVPRDWAKRMNLRTQIATSEVDGIVRALADVRATPVLWQGEEGFDSLTIYGFYKDFSIDLALETISYCSMTIEGLT